MLVTLLSCSSELWDTISSYSVIHSPGQGALQRERYSYLECRYQNLVLQKSVIVCKMVMSNRVLLCSVSCYIQW